MQAHVGVQALRRIRRQSTLQRAPLKLQCRPIPDEPYNKEDPDIRATHQELTQALKSVFEQAPVYLEQMRHVRTGDFQVPSTPPASWNSTSLLGPSLRHMNEQRMLEHPSQVVHYHPRVELSVCRTSVCVGVCTVSQH